MLGAIILSGVAITASASSTDFGVRIVGVPYAPARATEAAIKSVVLGQHSLQGAATLASRWGQVTSTYRSPEHNRRVGGVRNSFHLSGRALDIARRAGISHGDVVAAYRNAGYQLVEALDEGDHSHLAFSFGASRPASLTATRARNATPSSWKVVFAPR